ncbi:hypothetical protein [Micromonospora aurantiaca (nom. illeg.)]|uniref:hypothetical protein n=1 Tax=Micromonospora aurantiaca (nom. illeg.) TaxID=47850 RepID=UPI0016572F1F|nr:hypothetical protein [Micromonospora aurantiaca]MBC9006732.1 hypothetical protein [Micromonospora aurantiaca]
MIEVVGEHLRAGARPWQVYPITAGTGNARLRRIPALPGPMIYAVPDWNGWSYVGLTVQNLPDRLRGHLREPAKAARWAAVMALPLDADVGAVQIARLERAGKDLLAPRTGSRWSTGRG